MTDTGLLNFTLQYNDDRKRVTVLYIIISVLRFSIITFNLSSLFWTRRRLWLGKNSMYNHFLDKTSE